jgi:carbon storage regulator CsrA
VDRVPTSRRETILVLARKSGERVVIGKGISVTVAAVQGNRVWLAFDAPNDVRLLGSELASGTVSQRPVTRQPKLAF